jgi:hypothetical protein
LKKILLVIFALMFLDGCQEGDRAEENEVSLEYVIEAIDEVTVGSLQMTILQTAHGPVMLHSESPDTLALNVPAPCYFNRDSVGNIRVVERDGVHILLVENSTPDPDPANKGDCITWAQGIVIAQDGLHIIPTPTRVAACPPLAWDEKVFTSFGEDFFE